MSKSVGSWAFRFFDGVGMGVVDNVSLGRTGCGRVGAIRGVNKGVCSRQAWDGVDGGGLGGKSTRRGISPGAEIVRLPSTRRTFGLIWGKLSMIACRTEKLSWGKTDALIHCG